LIDRPRQLRPRREYLCQVSDQGRVRV